MSQKVKTHTVSFLTQCRSSTQLTNSLELLLSGGANIINDKLHEESLLGRGKGTRLSTRKSDTRRHCESGNSTGKFY